MPEHFLSFLTRKNEPRSVPAVSARSVQQSRGADPPLYKSGQPRTGPERDNEKQAGAPSADRRLSGELPPAVSASYRELADLIERWDHAGISSGHAWAPCDHCRQMTLMPRDGGRRCIMTPGCPGTHRVPGQRPTPLDALRRGLVDQDDFRRWPPLDMGPVLRRELS